MNCCDHAFFAYIYMGPFFRHTRPQSRIAVARTLMRGSFRSQSKLSREDAVELRFDRQTELTERWRGLTSARRGPVALTYSGLGSSRSTSIGWIRLSSILATLRVAVAALVSLSLTSGDAAELRAGRAKVVITPPVGSVIGN